MLPWSGLAGLERTWYGSAQQLALYLPAHTHTSPPRPESVIGKLYANAYKALKPGGRLLVHDFMVNDSLDGPVRAAAAPPPPPPPRGGAPRPPPPPPPHSSSSSSSSSRQRRRR